MKPSPLKRTTPLRSNAKLRIAGHCGTAITKREIQRLLREIVILRDGGPFWCILRNIHHCGGEPGFTFLEDGVIGKVVLQADHLITRANSATYADSRLVV